MNVVLSEQGPTTSDLQVHKYRYEGNKDVMVRAAV